MPANSPSATATSPSSHSRVNAQNTCAPSTTRSGSASPRATAIRRRRSISPSMIGGHGPSHRAAPRAASTRPRSGRRNRDGALRRAPGAHRGARQADPAVRDAGARGRHLRRGGMDARRRADDPPRCGPQPVRPLRGISARRAGLPARLAPRLGARRRPLRRPARRADGTGRGGAPGGPRRAAAVRARGMRLLRRGVRPLRHHVSRLLRGGGRVRRGVARPRRPRRRRDARRLRAIGGDPDDIASCARDAASTVGWLELHIEQGPALETEGLPIGVVTGIQAQVRHAWEIRGTRATPAPRRWPAAATRSPPPPSSCSPSRRSAARRPTWSPPSACWTPSRAR